MAITAQLAGTIQLTDTSTNSTIFYKQLLNLLMTGTSFQETQAASIGTSPVSIALPVSPTNFLYVKNLHATQTLTVTWTPNGGSSAVVQTLEPGSALLLIQTSLTAGITALSLTGSGAATTCEYILAG
jgi:hypothetical protein